MQIQNNSTIRNLLNLSLNISRIFIFIYIFIIIPLFKFFWKKKLLIYSILSFKFCNFVDWLSIA